MITAEEKYKIDSKLPKLKAQDITQFEKSLNVTLPASYKNFLTTNNGGIPYLDSCDVMATDNKILYTFVIKKFLGINPRGYDDLMKMYLKHKSKIPTELLPIAYDRFHNFMCLNLLEHSIFFCNNNPQKEGSEHKNPLDALNFDNYDDKSTPEPDKTATTDMEPVSIYLVAKDFDTFFNKLYRKRFN